METVDEWKSAWMVCGGQCATMVGILMMLRQCVENLDTKILVCVARITVFSQLTLIYKLERGIPTRKAYFGEGNGPIHLTNAQCTSDNTELIHCDIDNTGMNNCDHSEDAGVICYGKNESQFS